MVRILLPALLTYAMVPRPVDGGHIRGLMAFLVDPVDPRATCYPCWGKCEASKCTGNHAGFLAGAQPTCLSSGVRPEHTHTPSQETRGGGRPKIAAIAVQKTEADPMGVSSETLVLQNRLRMSRVKRLFSRVQFAQADV